MITPKEKNDDSLVETSVGKEYFFFWLGKGHIFPSVFFLFFLSYTRSYFSLPRLLLFHVRYYISLSSHIFIRPAITCVQVLPFLRKGYTQREKWKSSFISDEIVRSSIRCRFQNSSKMYFEK